ncbi:MAG: Gfo/Idh/MocA family oxidoreductase [Oscillospiraceae bacterium]|nr:Gfo/Idh/MocA family oxidoreductase [Oscillospiraceae bacterium]
MLKVGLIGCGFMGGMHAACYKEIEGAQIVAVADVRSEKAEEIAKAHGAEIYATGDELIVKADVDIIDICLPTYLHTHHAVEALRRGKNVFIEKPVCLTAEEGELLVALQKESGTKVQVGQVIRFWDEYKWLKEASDSGRFGKIRSAVFKRLSSVPGWAWEGWLHDAEKSGSVALDMHIHDVDFVRYLMGEPSNFATSVARNSKGVIEQIFTTFNYKEASVTVEACWDYPADFPFDASFRVKFEKATVVLDANGLNVYYNVGGKEKVEIKPDFEAGNDIGGNISSLGGYYNELKYFVDTLLAGKEPVIAPLDDAVKSVRLALKEIESVGGAQLR